MATTTLQLPFQPNAMSPAQLAAVSYLARYSGFTHRLYTYQLKRWFDWCDANSLWTRWSASSALTSSCTSCTVPELSAGR